MQDRKPTRRIVKSEPTPNVENLANVVMGLFVDTNGYVTGQDGRYHRLVWESENGAVPSGWHVHHIDGVKTNNSIENLIALPGNLHTYIHAIQMRDLSRLNRSQIEELLDWHHKGHVFCADSVVLNNGTPVVSAWKYAAKRKTKNSARGH
jgi:hypothetical protein